MTIEEKKNALINFCENRDTCTDCPLEELNHTDNACYTDLPDEIIEEHYQIVFGKDDSPIKPNYYNDTKIAPIDVIEDWDLDFCLGSALKYIKRCGKKENNPSVQDLKKVIWYIERRIKELEEATNEREN